MKPNELASQIMQARRERKERLDMIVGVSMAIIGTAIITLFFAGVL